MSHPRRPLRAVAVALLTFFSSLGCPRTDPPDTSGEEEESEEPSGKRLDQLNASELRELCADLNEELATRFSNRRLVTYGCTRVYIQSGDGAACALGVDECVLQSPEASSGAPRPPEFQLDELECARLQNCSVSLEAFDTCIAARFDQTDRLLARLECRLANDPEAVEALTQELDGPRDLPSSCTSLEARCPGTL